MVKEFDQEKKKFEENLTPISEFSGQIPVVQVTFSRNSKGYYSYDLNFQPKEVTFLQLSTIVGKLNTIIQERVEALLDYQREKKILNNKDYKNFVKSSKGGSKVEKVKFPPN